MHQQFCGKKAIAQSSSCPKTKKLPVWLVANAEQNHRHHASSSLSATLLRQHYTSPALHQATSTTSLLPPFRDSMRASNSSRCFSRKSYSHCSTWVKVMGEPFKQNFAYSVIPQQKSWTLVKLWSETTPPDCRAFKHPWVGHLASRWAASISCLPFLPFPASDWVHSKTVWPPVHHFDAPVTPVYLY